jgi:hypothetical protein
MAIVLIDSRILPTLPALSTVRTQNAPKHPFESLNLLKIRKK